MCDFFKIINFLKCTVSSKCKEKITQLLIEVVTGGHRTRQCAFVRISRLLQYVTARALFQLVSVKLKKKIDE